MANIYDIKEIAGRELSQEEQDRASGIFEGLDPTMDNTALGVSAIQKATKSPVSAFSTDSAISTVNNDMSALDAMAPITAPKTESKKESVPDTQKESKPSTGPSFSFEEAQGIWGNDFTGITQTADGEYAADSSALARAGITGLQVEDPSLKLEKGVSDVDVKIEKLVNDFETYNVDNDPTYQAQAQGIRSEFDKLKRQMADINERREDMLRTTGIRGGAGRYAREIDLGIVGEEITQGSERLAEISRQESSAIMQARQAVENNNYVKLNQQVGLLKTLREGKADALENYNNKLVEANKKMQEDEKFDLDVSKYKLDYRKENFKQLFDIQKFESDVNQAVERMKLDREKFGFDVEESGEKMSFDREKFEFDMAETAKRIGLDESEFQFNKEKFFYEYEFQNKKFDEDVKQNGVDNALNQLKYDILKEDNDLERQIKFEKLRKETLEINKEILQAKDNVLVVQDKITNISSLINHPGMNSAVGSSFLSRGNKINIWDKLTSNTQDFIGSVNQLISQDTLKTLIDLKQAGGTLGALSDQERIMLQSAASKIGDWAMRDENGKVTGYNISQTNFKKELGIIKTLAERALEKAKVLLPTDIKSDFDFFYKSAPTSDLDSIDSMINDKQLGATEEERKRTILEYFGKPGGFSMVGGDTNQASKIAMAIKKVESGGNYDAKGGSGESGAYQFMPSTWKGWAKQYLGNANAPMTKENQDKVAIAKINDLLKKGYNEEQIALIWNGGEAKVKKGVNKYGVKYDSGAYAKKVLAALS